MRPQQNNYGGKRSRGRNRSGGGGGGGGGGNHGHKPQNILHRSFESTGPDMKVRGTAQNVYEKYLQLARDANSSGDRVMAENYLQHAEHYYRIIAAAQAAMPPQQQQQHHQQQHQNYNNGQNRNGNGDDGHGDGQQDGEGGQAPTEAQVISTRPPPQVSVDDEQPVF